MNGLRRMNNFQTVNPRLMEQAKRLVLFFAFCRIHKNSGWEGKR